MQLAIYEQIFSVSSGTKYSLNQNGLLHKNIIRNNLLVLCIMLVKQNVTVLTKKRFSNQKAYSERRLYKSATVTCIIHETWGCVNWQFF